LPLLNSNPRISYTLRKNVCIVVKLVILIFFLQFYQRAVIIKWPEVLLKFEN